MDKIIRKGETVTLKEVLEILQVEYSTSKTLQNIDSSTKQVYYAQYDKKKSGSKGGKPKRTRAAGSPTMQNSNSTSSKVCYRCRKPWNKEHNKSCPAKNSQCNVCGQIGHYGKCCKKAGNFPGQKKPPTGEKKMIHVASLAENEFYNEDGNIRQKVHNHILSSQTGREEFLVQFGIRKELDSIDKKLILKFDTGSDVNAINWKTYKELFLEVKLKPSTVVLQNFDSSCVHPVGTFKCFIHW